MKNKKISAGNTKLTELYDLFNHACGIDLKSKKARLFPNGNTNNENQTTSIFLASLSAVKEYREELILGLGDRKIKAFNAKLHTFTQINSEDKKDKPDGLIVITTGKHEPIVEWACLVEAKIDKNPIDVRQVKRYVKFGKNIGITNLLTISNDLATSPNQSPIKNKFSKVELRGGELFHWSWTYLKVTSSRLIRDKAIEDEDHIYLLKELRNYFDSHPKLKNYIHMGKSWKDSSKIVSNSIDKNVNKQTSEDVSKSFMQEEKDLSLQLTDQSKMHVELFVKENRDEQLIEMISQNKQVVSTFMINGNKQNTFDVVVNFIGQEIICLVNVCIKKGKSKSQTTQLLNMLMTDSAVPDKIKIRAIYKYNKTNEIHGKSSLTDLIEQKSNPTINDYSILDKSLGDTVKHFEVKIREKIGTNFYSPTIFIKKLEETTGLFLDQVMCNIKG